MAQRLHLSKQRYWHQLLHMNNDISEIDDANFFFCKNGATDPQSELNATLKAFYSDSSKDDNSSICRFPARYFWLKKRLHADDFPTASCPKYDKILKLVNPKSVTLVFPSAHINSPASMFGHTFLRINSSYNSKLLSFAINYAANVNSNTENGVVFAIKGLFGGYYGKYSLLPYYDKLKEYRDSEQRDIWEYNLNFTQIETRRMFRHIWELNNTFSNYYFLTQNCSYNMLWLLELARPSLHLRDKFSFQVIPLETIHVAKEQNLIISMNYRPSKRTTLLKYETLLKDKNVNLVIDLVNSNLDVKFILQNNNISDEQKRYILESATEYLEYQLGRGKINKDKYLSLFHSFTRQRAKLGLVKALNIKVPSNPINGHRALRALVGIGSNDGELTSYLGFRVAYHSLGDSDYGFLRGTQIEFANILLSKTKTKTKIEKATIISIESLAQRSKFFKNFSWRTKIGWDSNYLSRDAAFYTGVGAGYSWGDKSSFIYFLIDPMFYVYDKLRVGIGGSIGFIFDRYKFMNINAQLTQRVYDNGKQQVLIKISQGFRISQNIQLMLKYDYKDKLWLKSIKKQERIMCMFRYYF